MTVSIQENKTCSTSTIYLCLVIKLGVYFSRFPLNNPSLLRSWLNAMKWDNWKPSKYAVFCEKHFTRDDYVKVEGWKRLKSVLKRDAVPSVFNFPPHLKKAAKGRTPVKRKAPSPKDVTENKPLPPNPSVMQDPVTENKPLPPNPSVIEDLSPENKPLPPNPTVMEDRVAENKPKPPTQSVMQDHNYCTSPSKVIPRLR
jgi:hypothetical protein